MDANERHFKLSEVPLNPHEKEEAGQLWDALLFAPSLDHLRSARLRLKASSCGVQQVVMGALVVLLANSIEPNRSENPFEAEVSVQELEEAACCR